MTQDKTIHLFPSIQPVEAGTVRSQCILERRDGDQIAGTDTLWYEYPQNQNSHNSNDAEAFLIACIMLAMAEERSLYVHGAVSMELLANLEEFCSAWCSWIPWRYKRIIVTCDTILEGNHSPTDNKAMLAFTSGLDSTFSLWRHAFGNAGYATKQIVCAVFVHGFDIPLSDQTGFEAAFRKAETTLSSLGIPLVPVRTNFREVIPLEWDDTHMVAVVSCLQNMKGLCSTALVASTKPYLALQFPLGSNPITDPLLSSATLRVIHDGATHGRDQKVLAISSWQLGCDNLRVCYEGKQRDQNCCRCAKCLITMSNFRANNLPLPSAFPIPFEPSGRQLIRVRMKILPSSVWPQILADARANGVRESWVWVLAVKVRFNRQEIAFRKVYSPLRIWLQKTLNLQRQSPLH